MKNVVVDFWQIWEIRGMKHKHAIGIIRTGIHSFLHSLTPFQECIPPLGMQNEGDWFLPSQRGHSLCRKTSTEKKKKVQFLSSSSIILVSGSLCWLWMFKILMIDSDGELWSAFQQIDSFYTPLSPQGHLPVWYFNMISRYVIDIYVNIPIAENNCGMYPIENIWAEWSH